MTRRTMKAAALAAFIVVVAACAGGASDTTAATTSRLSTGAGRPTTVVTTAVPQWTTTRVDVEGYEIAIRCKGIGATTVLFLSDIGEDGDMGWTASGVPDSLLGDAEVCVYDRPGLGASDPAPTPRTIANHVFELRALVEHGTFSSPLVLVADGFGCLVARGFAKENVRAVNGLVLVDPSLDLLDTTAPLNTSAGQQAELTAVAELNANLGAFGPGALPLPPLPTIVIGSSAQQSQLARTGPFGSFVNVDSIAAESSVQQINPKVVVDAVRKVLNDARASG